MELLKYVYFRAQKSIIMAGNNKFQDLINASRTYLLYLWHKVVCMIQGNRQICIFDAFCRVFSSGNGT